MIKIVGPGRKIVYSSVPTRNVSLQFTMGGAEGNEKHAAPIVIPGEVSNNLETGFRSGVNRHDLPSCYGPPKVDKKIGPRSMKLDKEVKTWVRNKGEPTT